MPIFVIFNVALFFVYNIVYAQVLPLKRLINSDTLILDYQADTAFHNRIRQVHSRLLFGIPTSTHIRFESHGVPGRFKYYFVQDHTGKFDNIVLTKGPKKYRLFEPYTIFSMPQIKSKLLSFESLFVLVDSNNQYIRKWKMDRSFRYSIPFHVSQVNEYYIDSTLVILFIPLNNDLKDNIEKADNPILPSIGHTPIHTLFKKRKLNIKDFNIQNINCGISLGVDYWRSAIYADTTRKSIWLTTANLGYLSKFSILDNTTECFKLPDPIPPGIENLTYQSNITESRRIDNVIKINPQDSVSQLTVHPMHLYVLPNCSKLLNSYFVSFNEENGDTTILKALPYIVWKSLTLGYA